MERANRMRKLARRAFFVSVVIGVIVFGYFLQRGDATSGLILGIIILAAGYTEYKRRLLDAAAEEEASDDPFERRERLR